MDATHHGSGNRLAYTTCGSGILAIAVINADGSGQRQITTPAGLDLYGNAITDFAPAWSPLGNKIAFCSTRSGSDIDIWTVNSDGTGLQQVTQGAFSYWLATAGYESIACYLRWSPDGTKIAFTGDTSYVPHTPAPADYVENVYVVNIDGSNLTQLTSCRNNDADSPYQSVCGLPSWSPDGTRIAFSDENTVWGDNIGGGGIYTMNSDGSNILAVLQDNKSSTLFPQWSTDGKRIFVTYGPSSVWGVYSLNSDGTDITEIIPTTNKYSPYGIDCSRCSRFDK